MATEEGVVIKTDLNRAWVKTTRSGACDSCATRSSCNAMGGGKEMEVHTINDIGAQIDDRVVMRFNTGSLLKASFLLYIVPILGLIIGAAIGQAGSIFLQLDPSTGSVIGAFIVFVLAVVFVKSKGDALSRKRDYQPQITKILS